MKKFSVADIRCCKRGNSYSFTFDHRSVQEERFSISYLKQDDLIEIICKKMPLLMESSPFRSW